MDPENIQFYDLAELADERRDEVEALRVIFQKDLCLNLTSDDDDDDKNNIDDDTNTTQHLSITIRPSKESLVPPTEGLAIMARQEQQTEYEQQEGQQEQTQEQDERKKTQKQQKRYVSIIEMKQIQEEDLNVQLQFILPKYYPLSSPLVKVIDPHGILSLDQLSSLMTSLNLEASTKNTQSCMLFELTSLAEEFLVSTLLKDVIRFNSQIVWGTNGKWQYQNRKKAEEVKKIRDRKLRMEEAKQQRTTQQQRIEGEYDNWNSNSNQSSRKRGKLPEAASCSAWKKEYNLRYTGEMHPSAFVGVIPIFRALQEAGLCVQSLENVLRDDLAIQFMKRWTEYGAVYGSGRNQHVYPPPVIGTAGADAAVGGGGRGSAAAPQVRITWPLMGERGSFSFLGENQHHHFSMKKKLQGAPCAQPIMAFHGTKSDAAFSIVRNGLVTGGSNSRVDVRCGQTYGAGVYCSPDPMIAKSYATNDCLIVCAVLLGKARVISARLDFHQRSQSKDYDSHTDPSSFAEWIIFDRYSILPCWVVKYSHVHVPNSIGSQLYLSKSGAMVQLKGKFQKKMEEVNTKEMGQDEMSRKVEFWLGPNRKVLEIAPHEDDEDEFDCVGRSSMIHALSEDEIVTECGRHFQQRFEDPCF